MIKEQQKQAAPIEITQAIEPINEKLAKYPHVNVYGRWACAPQRWTDSDINIDAGYEDPPYQSKTDRDGYNQRFAEIAALLRTKGHIVDVALGGLYLRVYRRGTEEALQAALVQGTLAGIHPGDIVILSHGLGTECKRVVKTDDEFLHFDPVGKMTRGWVRDILRTSIPIDWFKRKRPTHWIKVTELRENGSTYKPIGDMQCLSQVISELANEVPHQFNLAEYDGWGERGGAGKLISELGVFTVYRVGMQVFVERADGNENCTES